MALNKVKEILSFIIFGMSKDYINKTEFLHKFSYDFHYCRIRLWGNIGEAAVSGEIGSRSNHVWRRFILWSQATSSGLFIPAGMLNVIKHPPCWTKRKCPRARCDVIDLYMWCYLIFIFIFNTPRSSYLEVSTSPPGVLERKAGNSE